MRRPYAVVLSACLAVATAGCSGLSTSSAVQPGLEVGSLQENEVRVLPPGPSSGSTPQQVVNGFIRAGAATDEEYQVARSFLADGSESSWRPDRSVVVFTDESSLTITTTTPTTVKAVAKETARIDSSGRFQEMPPESTVELTFGVRKVGGEWRITQVPEAFGTWLSQSDVDRLYASFRLYFVGPDRTLVPDTRWFPLGSGLAARLARALLSGVPDYLNGAVRTEVPAGTRLAIDTVPIESGTATVDLTATKLSADPTQRQALAAQLLATVGQVPGVERVALQFAGADLQIPGTDGSVESLRDLGFVTQPDSQAKPVLRTGSKLVHIDPEQVGDPAPRKVPNPTETLPQVPPGWAYLAVSLDGREIAGVGGDRTGLARWRGVDQVVVPAFAGSKLTRPAYDRMGMLWVAGRTNGKGAVWVVNAGADPSSEAGRPTQIDVPWLDKRGPVSIRVSPDGQRVALISLDENGAHPRLDVAGIRREPNGVPTGLADNLTLAPSLSLMRDVVWVEAATLAVLGRKDSTQVLRPWFVPLGGPLVDPGPEIAGAEAITTVNGERGLVVTTDKDEVLIRAGNRWQGVGKGDTFIVPGR